MIAVKIKTFRLGKRQMKQFQPTIPRNWIEEMGLREGDSVHLMRDQADRLILVPVREGTE